MTMVPARSVPFAALAAALAAWALCGCDPPPAEEALLGPTLAEPFAAERATSVRTVPADGTIRIRFTQDVDSRSIGPRSVRVTRGPHGRLVRVHAWSEGR